jgi:hypothetical protein
MATCNPMLRFWRRKCQRECETEFTVSPSGGTMIIAALVVLVVAALASAGALSATEVVTLLKRVLAR